jgi:glycosyltransferase involved in cell wall biosynthesis
VRIYHAVGNFQQRTVNGRNLKSSHIYVPLIERMKAEGHDVEMLFVHGVPNREVRFTQVQADIVVDMLTFGWFGSNVREAMMLGKPVVCYLRDEWLERMRREIPDYVDELPIVNATPETVEGVLADLVGDPERRRELGERSRAFALRFHSAAAGARRMDQIYRELLGA